MRILHVFPFSVFVVNYIRGFSNEKENEHYFWLYGYNSKIENSWNIAVPGAKNIIKVDNDYASLLSLYNYCDMFLLIPVPETLKLCQILHKCYINEPKPFAMNIWGREVYRTSNIYRHPGAELDEIDSLKTFFFEKCNFIISASKDYEYAHKNFNTNCDFAQFNALFGFSAKDYKFPIKVNDVKRKNVLVGHRGTETGRHAEILEALGKYESELTKVICPLSYGNQDYIDYIDKRGRSIFGVKWHPLTKLMGREKYFEFLNDFVDIAVFNNSESEGANTIFGLTFMGKKIYISKDNASYKTLEELDVEFFEWNGKVSKDFFELLESGQVEHNRLMMEKFGNEREIIEKWKIIFRKCMEKLI